MSGNLHFKNCEYIQDVGSTTAFAITKYPINPGLGFVFPFLSQLAGNYEQYHFHSLRFVFKSTSANALNNTNTALGTVILGVNYDVISPDFTSKFEMNNYVGTKSQRPSAHAVMSVRAAAYKTLYIRTGTPPGDADLRLYDHANFYFATEGSQAAADIGELWVEYEVTLKKPKLSDALGWDTSMAIWYNATGVDNGHPFGTLAGQITAASIDVIAGPSATTSVQTPAGIGIDTTNNRIYFNPRFGMFLLFLLFRGYLRHWAFFVKRFRRFYFPNHLLCDQFYVSRYEIA